MSVPSKTVLGLPFARCSPGRESGLAALDRCAPALSQERAEVDHGGRSLLGRGCLEHGPIGGPRWSPSNPRRSSHGTGRASGFGLGRSGTEEPVRAAVSQEVRDQIRTMSRANPLWGAPRIHGELLKLGIHIGETSVSKYMVRQRFSRQEPADLAINQAFNLRTQDNLGYVRQIPYLNAFTVQHWF